MHLMYYHLYGLLSKWPNLIANRKSQLCIWDIYKFYGTDLHMSGSSIKYIFHGRSIKQIRTVIARILSAPGNICFCVSCASLHYSYTEFFIINKHKPRVYSPLKLSFGQKRMSTIPNPFIHFKIDYQVDILLTPRYFFLAKNPAQFCIVSASIQRIFQPFYVSDIYYPVIGKSQMPKFYIWLSDQAADFHLRYPATTMEQHRAHQYRV